MKIANLCGYGHERHCAIADDLALIESDTLTMFKEYRQRIEAQNYEINRQAAMPKVLKVVDAKCRVHWLFDFLAVTPRTVEVLRNEADRRGTRWDDVYEALAALGCEWLRPWPGYGGYGWMPKEAREWRWSLPDGTFDNL